MSHMRIPILPIHRIVAILWIGLALLTSCSWQLEQALGNASDEEYVSIARTNREAQALLSKFPQAETSVDREGRLAVDFRVPKPFGNEAAERWEGLRLRVFIDPKTNQATESFIDCNTKIVRENLKRYLEQYAITQTCP